MSLTACVSLEKIHTLIDVEIQANNSETPKERTRKFENLDRRALILDSGGEGLLLARTL